MAKVAYIEFGNQQCWFRFHGHSTRNESGNRLRVHERIGPEGAKHSSADAAIITRFRVITRGRQLAKNLKCPHTNHCERDHRPADHQFQHKRHGAPPTLEFPDFAGSQRTPTEACEIPMAAHLLFIYCNHLKLWEIEAFRTDN
jgi:hypothetical protein